MELNIGNKRIEQLFAKFFGLDSSYIHQCYRELKDSYNQKLSLPYEGFIPKQKESWEISFKEKQTLNNWENSTLIGVDLPLFFKCSDPEAQTVMLVALDPLRKRKDFPDFQHEDVIIGTPFAQHSSHYREGSQEIVFDFIKHIVDKNYHMYITDVYKVWVEQKEYKKSHLLFKRNESLIFKELLREELDIIDPKIVITFGNDARDRYIDISKDCDPRPHKHFTHPSGEARGAWKKLIGKYSKPMVLDYLKTEIDKELD